MQARKIFLLHVKGVEKLSLFHNFTTFSSASTLARSTKNNKKILFLFLVAAAKKFFRFLLFCYVNLFFFGLDLSGEINICEIELFMVINHETFLRKLRRKLVYIKN